MNIEHLYSHASEIAVLGTMLAQPLEVIDEVTSTLSKADFFVSAHQEVFSVLVDMHGSEAIDVQTVHQRLSERKLASTVGSPGILAECLTGFASHLNVSAYVKTVKRKSLLRALKALGTQIDEDVTEMPDELEKIIDRAEITLGGIAEPSRTPQIYNAKALTARFEAHLGQIDRGERLGAVKTGYASLDRINGGLKPNGMHVIGGRSGLGKTTVMLNLAENLCKMGTGVGIISLEMDDHELMSSIYSFMSDINSRRFKEKLDSEQWNSVRWATEKINGWNIQVDDCTLVDVHSMRHKARKMVKDGAQVIMVDYLQLLDDSASDKKHRNRAESVAEMSRSIKLLGKELNVPMIIGAQLNRQAAQGEPGMHQLRESGAIEQDADVVILLRQRDEADKSPRPIITWNIAKWRGGEANIDLDFIFDKTRQRFHEQTPRTTLG